jgi:hypothetical protein
MILEVPFHALRSGDVERAKATAWFSADLRDFGARCGHERQGPDPPTCSGRMRVMATLPSPGTVKKILAHLGMPTEPLPRARARDPTGQESFDFDAA